MYRFGLKSAAILTLVVVTAFQNFSLAQSAATKENPEGAKPAAPTAAKPGSTEARIEQYLRNLYAWGPSFDVKVGPSKPSPIPDLLEVPVTVSMGGQSDTAVV